MRGLWRVSVKSLLSVSLTCSILFYISPNGEVIAAQNGAINKQNTYSNVQDPIPSIIKKMSPTVVGIIGTSTEKSDNGELDSSDQVHGSGIILKSNGWIVTNVHVIQNIKDPMVILSNGKSYKVRETYVDPKSDLAVIKINGKGLPTAKFALNSQKSVVGEKVIAIGTPALFTLRNSASVGIISGLNRNIGGNYRYIQTDTAINPGNSGGALINLKGEVVGITSMKYVGIDVENIGFAIPSEMVLSISQQLITKGKVIRPSLGLDLEESASSSIGIPNNEPLISTEVWSNQAIKSGIKIGDKLYRINGTSVNSIVDINELLKTYKPGQRVTLWMESRGDIVKRNVVLTQVSSLDDELYNFDGE